MIFKKPKEVKAAVMTEPGKMEIRKYPYPKINNETAIIKIEMCGVCGTDKHIFRGDALTYRGKSLFPMPSGHEIIGTIFEIGNNAAKCMEAVGKVLKVGDRVAVEVEVNCGKCWYCINQYDNITCENQVMAYGGHPSADVPPYLRGGFAEYMYIFPNSILFKIPEDMPTEVAVFVEEMAVAYSSLSKASQPYPAVKEGFGPGDSVVVLGNGPLGILHGIMSKIQGAGMMIATDLADSRLKVAKSFYADFIINAENTTPEERIQKVKDLTDGIGPDMVIECAGEPEVFLEALGMVRKGGTVIEVGNWVEREETVPLNVVKNITSKNLHIHSIYHCGHNWMPVLKIMNEYKDRFSFETMISHKINLEELVNKMHIVTDPNKCMKIEVIPL